jgi:UMF1 family MFS transporter
MSTTATDKPAEPITSALGSGEAATKRSVFAWAMWDWGTQPFNTVVTTFVFAVYITSDAFGSTNATSQALSVSTTIAGLIIALAAPVLGQNADRSGHTVRDLKWMTWIVALLTAALFFVAPEPNFLYLGLALLAVGSIVSEIASVNYNSLLERVANGGNVGKISGFGWGMGYLGGILVLLLVYVGWIQPEVGWFGIVNENSMGIRFAMVICGLWIVLFTLMTFTTLRDPITPARTERRNGVIASYRSLGQTIKRMWKTQRHTGYFLLASALFRDGLAGVFAFGAVIAAGTFDFTSGDVIIFGVAANVRAGVATIIFGRVDDRVGPKTVIMASLAILSVAGTLIFVLHDRGPIVFWILGLVMSACVGPAQAASRSFLARLIPLGKSGEIFGLYATTGRVVSFLSPAAFGLMIALGAAITGQHNTQYFGILGIVAILAIGFFAMIPVKKPAAVIALP